MKTDLKLIHEFLNLDQRFLIPLFQRGYSWSREEQWELLWDDVLNLVEQVISGKLKTHFMGAVVIQDTGENSPGSLPAWEVVDGQQRLLTIQVLADAASLAMKQLGQDKPARRLRKLTENDPDYRAGPDDTYKLWPTNKDRDAFIEVMAKEEPFDYIELDSGAHRITRAHAFFYDATKEFLGGHDGESLVEATEALTTAITNGLEVVAITLDSTENAQEIFETLNARMTPLQPTDLIKNYLFQRLGQDGESVEEVYLRLWQPLETEFWEEELVQGRIRRQRLTAFFVYWLEMMTAEDIPSSQVFPRFKRFVEQEWVGNVLGVLEALRESAEVFEEITKAIDGNSSLEGINLSMYRFLSMDLSIFWPITLWLRRSGGNAVPGPVAEEFLGHLESWVVRRFLMGERTQAYAKFVVPMLKHLRQVDRENLANELRNFLASQNANTTYWPSDSRVRSQVKTKALYRSLTRARLRVILEALEDDARGFTTNHAKRAETRVSRDVMQIEHIMPREWEENWPLENISAEEREASVHLLGNLTILEKKFNASISNAPWTTKREAFNKHSIQLLNSAIKESEAWGEEQISQRTAELIERILDVWPAPGSLEDLPANNPQRPLSEKTRAITFRDLVDSDLLKIGQTVFWYVPGPKKPGPLHVTADYHLRDDLGVNFKSPSEAATKLTGSSYNGWKTWITSDGVSLDDLRAELENLLSAQMLDRFGAE